MEGFGALVFLCFVGYVIIAAIVSSASGKGQRTHVPRNKWEHWEMIDRQRAEESRLRNAAHKLEIHAQFDALDDETKQWIARWKKYSHAKIHGVQFDSESGIPRQELLLRCTAGEELILAREPSNPYDSNAIMVVRQNGTDDLGHLPKEIAHILAPQMDRGAKAAARVLEITGLAKDRPSFLGANIVIGQNYAPHKKRAKKVPEDADVYGS